MEHFNQMLLKRVGRMWVESPTFFLEKLEKAADIYNHTPHSKDVGLPVRLWHAPKETWEYLVKVQM